MGQTPRHAPTTVVAKPNTAVLYGAARAALALLLLSLPATAAFAALTITAPRQDSLTTDPMITVRGTSTSDDPVLVQLKGDEDATAVEVINGKWSKPLTLFEGLNEVTVSSGGQTKVVLVTLTTMSVEGKTQKVFLDWPAATTEELKKIVVGTRQTTLTPAKQTAFANSVKDATRTIMEQNFSRFAIEFVDSAAVDEETHTIEFVSLAEPLVYGQSPHDCRNNTPNQKSTVFVGTFRDEMVNELDDWKPMLKTDSVDRRIADVAHALARTASHELGHSLGLVAESESPICGFMEGCDLNHTCPYSSPNPLAPRFADGRYIMDDGKLAKEFTRIGEKKPQGRTVPRAPATFNTFNGDYLLLILPP